VTLRRKALTLRWLTLLVLFGLVEALPRAGLVRPATLEPASVILGRLMEIIVTSSIPSPYFARTGYPTLASHVSATLGSILLSYAGAVVIGTAGGVLLWRVPLLARILQPYLVVYYALPLFALYPLFILLFGVGFLPIVLLGFCFAIVVVMVNTALGLRRVDEEVYPKVGRSLGLGPAQMYLSIYLPAAAPYVFSGWKLGFVYSTISVVASEFLISVRGLGHVIDRSYRNFETANMYAAILLVIAGVLVANAMLTRLERRLYRRRG
jgi:NitT/TauT family transport system permease protein